MFDINNFTLSDSEFANNKTPRIQICFCVETSHYTCGDSILRERMSSALQNLFDKIASDNTLKYIVDYCIITFAETVKINHKFMDDKSNIEFSIEQLPGEPNLKAALKTALKQIKLRGKDYRNGTIAQKPGALFVFSSGKTSEPLDELADNMRNLSNSRMDIMPILVRAGRGNSETPSRAVLESLTYSGTVYSPDMDISGMFELIGKSMQRISESSQGVIRQFRDSEDWDKYIHSRKD